MDITITTPALLFPAISVLFLAYANRYLAIANRIREQHDLFNKTQSHIAKKQIERLRTRIRLIIMMQLLAVMGIIGCVLTMGLIFLDFQTVVEYAFLISMVLIVLSLLVSMWELLISTQALNIELENMQKMNNWLIFTDLDGTLLDHHDYSYTQALPALNKISQLQIPLIINSSKTYAEIKELRRQMHNNCAFVVENGAAIFLPEGKLVGNDSQLKQIILGCPQADILKTLGHLREQYSLSFKSFSDYSVNELVKETGLSSSQADQAKQRLASEPLKWLDSQEKLKIFEQQLNNQGLQLIQGGRFYHVMGHNDKSLAMAWLLNKFKQQRKSKTIALGDSQNDCRMLEQADFAIVIRKPEGNHLKINKSPDQVIYSQHTASKGWQESIDELFIKLNIGEYSE